MQTEALRATSRLHTEVITTTNIELLGSIFQGSWLFYKVPKEQPVSVDYQVTRASLTSQQPCKALLHTVLSRKGGTKHEGLTSPTYQHFIVTSSTYAKEKLIFFVLFD